MEPKSFLYQEKDGIGIITLNRPDTFNSLTFEVYAELRDIFPELAKRDAVKVVVITGQGKGFCSGGDVNAIIGELMKMDTKGLLDFTRMTGQVIKNMRALPKPVIASVNGIAAGAGAVIALASDLRIASERAKFAFLFVRVGLAGADMGAAFLLPRLVGLGKATELLYTGDVVTAEEALRIGLVNKLVKEDALMSETISLASKLSKGPGFALGLTKEALNKELSLDLDSAIDKEAEIQALCMVTKDFNEGYRAFVEKRETRFQGK